MTDTKQRAPQPLRAILIRKNIEIWCTLVFEDESAVDLPANSVSVRGAQRQITSLLVGHGYAPAGRWSDEDRDDDGCSEWTRIFKPGPQADLTAILPAPAPMPARPEPAP
jgi:hypothetical protein